MSKEVEAPRGGGRRSPGQVSGEALQDWPVIGLRGRQTVELLRDPIRLAFALSVPSFYVRLRFRHFLRY